MVLTIDRADPPIAQIEEGVEWNNATNKDCFGVKANLGQAQNKRWQNAQYSGWIDIAIVFASRP